jgi:hypothetical protein
MGLHRSIRSFAVAALVVYAPIAAAQDDRNAGPVQSGEAGTRLTLYGQVNRALLHASDGSSSGTFFVDNDNSSTRFGFKAEGSPTNVVTIGSVIEIEVLSNSSRDVSLPSDGSLGRATFNDRRLEVYGQSDKYGNLWLGQGHTATDGVAEVDLTRTDVVTSSDIPDLAGGIRFNGSGPRISDVYANMDGLDRDDRIRYDTPLLSGFRGSLSYVGGGAHDLAVRYRGRYDRNTTLSAAAGYTNETGTRTDNREQYVASISARRNERWSGTFAIGARDVSDARDPIFYYAKLAYEQAGLFGIGRTAFAVDFARANDIVAINDEFTSYGAYLVQIIDRAGTDVYLGLRNHKLERTGATFDDILTFMAGARVKF